MASIIGYEWPQPHQCLGSECFCQRQWPNNPRPFYVMRYADDLLEFDATTLANARSYIASFGCENRVYIWDTISDRVM
jgi:hypothetical protein